MVATWFGGPHLPLLDGWPLGLAVTSYFFIISPCKTCPSWTHVLTRKWMIFHGQNLVDMDINLTHDISVRREMVKSQRSCAVPLDSRSLLHDSALVKSCGGMEAKTKTTVLTFARALPRPLSLPSGFASMRVFNHTIYFFFWMRAHFPSVFSLCLP